MRKSLLKLSFLSLLMVGMACTHKHALTAQRESVDSVKIVYNACTMEYAIRTMAENPDSKNYIRWLYWGISETWYHNGEGGLIIGPEDTNKVCKIEDAIKLTDSNQLQSIYTKWVLKKLTEHVKDSIARVEADSVVKCKNNFQ